MILTRSFQISASPDRTPSAPASPLSGLYKISASNLTSVTFRERSSTSLFEGRQQLYSQQLSAAVRVGQQLKSSAADDDEEPVVPPHVGDFCQDGKTLKVVSLSAGCRQPTLDDMHIRSTCKEDQTKGKKQDLAIAVSWHLLAFLASFWALFGLFSFSEH